MRREELLAIDVASEIRSLCEAQLRGTWQMPAEFVRFAIRSGASRVLVTTGWRRFSVHWRGRAVEPSTFDNLVLAFDETAQVAARQQAIADLETAGAEALLWGSGVSGARLRVDCFEGGRRRRLLRKEGRRPRIAVSDGAAPADGVVIRWSCSKLDRRRALMWLRMACRFAAADVSVNGQPVERGFAGGLYRLSLEEPVPCTIGLTRRGEEPVLWLLRDGIVAARATLAGYPPFEAAVELGQVVKGAASSADLRRELTPFVAELSDRAVWMMIQVAARPDRLTGVDGQRLVALLLRAARRGLRAHEIRELPLLPSLGGEAPLLSLVRLEALARRRAGRIFAIDPGDDAKGVLVDPGSAVVASPEVRNLLFEVTGLRFQPPPRGRAGLLPRQVEAFRVTARRAFERALGAVGPRVLPAEELTVDEGRLLAMLRSVVAPRTVDIGDGRRLRRTSNGYVLPRADPAVAAAARLVAGDTAWLYPLIMALQIDEGRTGSLRNRWRSFVKRL